MSIRSFLVLIFISGTLGARILGIVPTPSISHQLVFQPLWKELSLRGHQVTVLTTNPVEDSTLTNLTEIDLSFMYNALSTRKAKDDFKIEGIGTLLKLFDIFNFISKSELENEQVRALINDPKAHFDVVLVEALTPAMFYFAERFKCPFIGIISLEGMARDYRALGNPTSPALYPDILLPFFEDLNFVQRTVSFWFEVFMTLSEQWIRNGMEERLAEEHFGKGLPSVPEMRQKMSLLFTNTDSVLHSIRPLLPNVIQIGGGTHLKPSTPIPQDLKKRLDSTDKNGFIYFSLGGNIKSHDLPTETINLFLEVFAQLPYLVLWKFETDNLPNKPSNVVISKWFPQQDILKHPKLRLFITQGGLQSTEEAIYSKIPMLVVPFIADQYKNALKLVKKGVGLYIDIEEIYKFTAHEIAQNIEEIISNDSYKKAVSKLAELAIDQPMTGLEKAIWWTEYVIRNKGADHLKNQELYNIPWYQYILLDVMLFIVILFVLIVSLVKKVTKCLIVALRTKKLKKKLRHQK